jgi:hypothetical protein
MKTLALGAAVLGILLTTGSHSDGTGPLSPEITTVSTISHPSNPELTDVVQQYCVRCHNQERLTGNLSLETFAVEVADQQAETAEKMILKLRAGLMPPPGARRPEGDTLLTLVETLETVIDATAAARPNPGVRRFQRLNRAEYERVIHDLLALDVDAGRWLPEDTYLGNFDNMSAAQGLSTTLLEAYLRAATEISRLAVGTADALPSSVKYTNPIEVSQHAWDQLEGAPFGTRGGMVITHDFPADGEYVFSVQTLFGRGTGIEDLDFSIDGEGVALLGLENNGASSAPIQTEPIFVPAGQRRVAVAFVRRIEGPYEDRLSPHAWSFVGGEDAQQWANYGITALVHLTDLMITGPNNSRGISETPSREKIFICRPASPDEEQPCAESIISKLASEAYRRPATTADLEGPMSFYTSAAAEGGFELGVRTALQAILASPAFLFRLEREPPQAISGENYRLGDFDLASRLSFFLWGTSPDRELLELADQERLTDPSLLAAQVERMLVDPRSEALATRFAHQWLRLQDAAKNQPEPYFYPDFNRQLGQAMVRETELLFYDLVREDRSLLELFNADYTFVNESLARHYGIPGISGTEFRRVRYPDERRRGLLGHGSVLLLTSMSDRTSPVLRGKWVMEVLMGTPPPPPPPNIPAFDQTENSANGRKLTTRERLELHRANPTCNSCHRFMDPIGLALDNFDVTGKWRIRENGMPIDTRGTFYDGSSVNSLNELTNVLLKRPIPLARNFASNLLAYAIGRRVEYYDQPAIRAIVQEAEVGGYRMSLFIRGVVESVPFRMMRSQATAEALPDSGM